MRMKPYRARRDGQRWSPQRPAAHWLPTAFWDTRLGGPSARGGVVTQWVRVDLTSLISGACHLRAIRGGLWRRLAVIHGHSGHADLRPLLYRRGTTRMVRMGSPVRFRRGAPPARETGVSEDCWGRRLVIEASFESRPLGDGRRRRPLLGLAPALLLVRGSIPYRGGEGNTVSATALQARGYGSALGTGAESVSDGRAPPRPRATSSSRRPGVRA
jgi:hypothetical protein